MRQQIISDLEHALESVREECENVRGFIVYSFASKRRNISNVDLLLLYDRNPWAGCLNGDFSNLDTAISAQGFVAESNPIFHVIESSDMYLEDPTVIQEEFDFWAIKSYHFIGDDEAKEQLKEIVTGSRLLEF